MNDYRIRPAKRYDRSRIRRLVWRVRINPFGLRWRRFLVAVDADNALLGCGQLKSHEARVVELASIAVRSEDRGRGIAHALIERLLERGPRPLYLLCLPDMTAFYARFGFVSAPPGRLPRHFRRVTAFAEFARRFHRSRGPVVMRLD